MIAPAVSSHGDAAVVGLRVDVDTYTGTRDGVPALLRQLRLADARATFYFTLGPDNMGRHVWRLLRPAFLAKMLRSNAASLYGPGILLRGTLWPGPRIARALGAVMASAETDGHECGVHAWDHHLWQARVERMPRASIREQLSLACDAYEQVFGHTARTSAAAGWKASDAVLSEKEHFRFDYNSDCRGRSVFRPRIGDTVCAPQIPVTLPTYDELIGRDGISDANYNEHLLSLIAPDRLNVLTIHTEVEGVSRVALFAEFLRQARQRGVRFVPLCELLPPSDEVPEDTITLAPVYGREGNVCWQSSALPSSSPRPRSRAA